MFYVYDFNLFLKEIVKTYVKYAFYVTEALTIYELHIFFFLNSRKPQFLERQRVKPRLFDLKLFAMICSSLKPEKGLRNLWIILKKRKFTIITKVVWKVSRFCFARGEKRTHPSHLKTKMGHGKTLFLCSMSNQFINQWYVNFYKFINLDLDLPKGGDHAYTIRKSKALAYKYISIFLYCFL
jgi:hypothetical protein